VVTNQMKSLAHFTGEIPFSDLTGLEVFSKTGKECDLFLVKSDQMLIGWAVNPESDMSGRKVTVPGIKAGTYTLRYYHTWRGRFLTPSEAGVPEGEKELKIRAGKDGLSFTVPVLKISDGHAAYIGQDVAFILEPAE